MPHGTAVIGSIAAAFAVALLLGLTAARIGLPPIVGYLVAGMLVGPLTPGYVMDGGLASQAAAVGVVLLMFGVGLHFSLRDLIEARRVAVPGALAQIAITGSIGTALGRLLGLGWGGAVVTGLSLAVASTVVVLKGLEARDRLDSPDGRLVAGWLVVEDVTMVVALVLLPALAPALGGSSVPAPGGASSIALSLGIALLKVVAFATLMVVAGRRAVPWLLARVARFGSRELFTLTVLAIALGVGALAANVFGVSVALGAFLAGAVVSESELSHRAAADALPLQDAFAVLFFLSVGMLFDPRVLVQQPVRVLALLVIIVAGKATVSHALLRALGESPRTAWTIAGNLAQIGEFSFIIVGLGVSLGLLTPGIQTLIIAGAILSITVNQLVLATIERVLVRRETLRAPEPAPRAAQFAFTTLRDHVILVGYGRVGSTVAEALRHAGIPHVVLEEQERIVEALRRRGERAVHGDATRTEVLDRAGVATASLIVVTAPDPIRAMRIVEAARDAHRDIGVAVRTHGVGEHAQFEAYLSATPAPGRSVFAEREAALGLAHFALRTLGRTESQADDIISGLRKHRSEPGTATAGAAADESVTAPAQRPS